MPVTVAERYGELGRHLVTGVHATIGVETVRPVLIADVRRNPGVVKDGVEVVIEQRGGWPDKYAVPIIAKRDVAAVLDLVAAFARDGLGVEVAEAVVGVAAGRLAFGINRRDATTGIVKERVVQERGKIPRRGPDGIDHAMGGVSFTGRVFVNIGFGRVSEREGLEKTLAAHERREVHADFARDGGDPRILGPEAVARDKQEVVVVALAHAGREVGQPRGLLPCGCQGRSSGRGNGSSGNGCDGIGRRDIRMGHWCHGRNREQPARNPGVLDKRLFVFHSKIFSASDTGQSNFVIFCIFDGKRAIKIPHFVLFSSTPVSTF